jgi:hypothetical protein
MLTKAAILSMFVVTAALTACQGGEVIDQLSGTVVDLTGGPAPGVRVMVGSAVVTTDDEGGFSLRDVDSPYNVVLVAPESPDAFVVVGMTERAPTLRLFDKTFGAADVHGASITLDRAAEASETVGVSLAVPDDDSRFVSSGTAIDGTLVVRWTGNPDLRLHVYALRYELDPVTGAPVHYTGVADAELALTADAASTWRPSWTPHVRDAALVIDTHLPEGFSFSSAKLAIAPRGWRPVSYAYAVFGLPPSFVVPDLEGASFTVDVCAQDLGFSTTCGTLSSLVSGRAELALEASPLFPTRFGPVGVGTHVDWSSLSEGASALLFIPQGLVGPRYTLVTEAPFAVIPDLGALGVELPSKAPYDLALERNSALTTIAELAAEGPHYAPSSSFFRTSNHALVVTP